MTKKQIIKTLTEFNEWRRSGNNIPHSPEVIGKAIDSAIELLKDQPLTAGYQPTIDAMNPEPPTEKSSVSDDFSFTPLLSKYQNQKPKDFGDYQERCYPVSAVLDMFSEIKQNYKAAQQPQEGKWISVDRLNEFLITKMKSWLIPTSLDEEVLQIKAESYNEAIVDIRKHILSLPKQPQK